jgi:phosphoglycerate dehydrogenase-like enzyme
MAVVTDRTHVLLWTDSAAAYQEAIESEGLAARVAVEILPRKEQPSAEQKARTEAMMAYAVPPGLLSSMPKLRWVQAMTAGVEQWLGLPDLPPHLALTCARGTHLESMPENIIGALLYVAKPYAAAVENQKLGKWAPSMAQPLAGKTLGILGVGAIGKEVARIAEALGLRVIGTRRHAQPVPHVAQIFPADRMPEVLAQSDYVLLLLPATRDTDNLIDAGRLAQMKRSAWLLNFGRGHLIRDDDLVAAVKAGTIAGAVLDVYRQEPLPGAHPFWKTAGIIVLPHIGGPHPQRDRVVARLFAENLRRYLEGQPLKEIVDRDAGY